MRSSAVYEEVGDYPKPQLAPLPDWDDVDALARHALITRKPLAKFLVRAGLRLSGYKRFHENLTSQEAAEMFRKVNMRTNKLFGPAYSATVALRDDERKMSALERAATLALGAQALCREVMGGTLSGDSLRGEPLEMGQYPNLFATSLAVRNGSAYLHKSSKYDHLGVIVKGSVYLIEMASSSEIHARELATCLRSIVEEAKDWDPIPVTQTLVGDTPSTIKALGHLQKMSPTSLDALRSCFTLLCLDLDEAPTDAARAGWLAQAGNATNRWYPASCQFVVFGNGRAAALLSFAAYLDGNVMMRGMAEVQRRAINIKLGPVAPVPPLPFRKLEWNVSAALAKRAAGELQKIRDDQQATFSIEGIGREQLQAAGIDPVNTFVLAVMMAVRSVCADTPQFLQLVSASKYQCLPVGGAVLTTPEALRFLEKPDNQSLERALASFVHETREERKSVPLHWLIEIFLRTKRSARAKLVAILTYCALIATRGLPKGRVVLSHPQVWPELELVGRPGVRLPYVTHFGLHYQLFEQRTVFTFMPGANWRKTNTEMASRIEKHLREIGEMRAHSLAAGYSADEIRNNMDSKTSAKRFV